MADKVIVVKGGSAPFTRDMTAEEIAERDAIRTDWASKSAERKLENIKKLRKKTSLPVIFLTSKDDEIDELLGLKLGADDFIKKSGGFSIKVLIERIRLQLRKKNPSNIEEAKNIINHGKLRLDASQLECEWDKKQLPCLLYTSDAADE